MFAGRYISGAAVAVLVIVGLVAPGGADHAPVHVDPLSRGGFVDDVSVKFKVKADRGGTTVAHVKDPSDVMVVRITVQPGAQIPWHTHPGPVVVTVTEGTLTYVDEHCERRQYPSGSAFVDPGRGHAHTALNLGGGPVTLYATFFDVETGPTIPATAPSNCDPRAG